MLDVPLWGQPSTKVLDLECTFLPEHSASERSLYYQPKQCTLEGISIIIPHMRHRLTKLTHVGCNAFRNCTSLASTDSPKRCSLEKHCTQPVSQSPRRQRQAERRGEGANVRDRVMLKLVFFLGMLGKPTRKLFSNWEGCSSERGSVSAQLGLQLPIRFCRWLMASASNNRSGQVRQLRVPFDQLDARQAFLRVRPQSLSQCLWPSRSPPCLRCSASMQRLWRILVMLLIEVGYWLKIINLFLHWFFWHSLFRSSSRSCGAWHCKVVNTSSRDMAEHIYGWRFPNHPEEPWVWSHWIWVNLDVKHDMKSDFEGHNN